MPGNKNSGDRSGRAKPGAGRPPTGTRVQIGQHTRVSHVIPGGLVDYGAGQVVDIKRVGTSRAICIELEDGTQIRVIIIGG